MEWKIKLKVNNREYITVYSYKGLERKSAIEDAIKQCINYVSYEIKREGGVNIVYKICCF